MYTYSSLASALAHCGFKWVKYARYKFNWWCDFTSFSKQFSADLHHFRFLFLCTSHSKLVKLLQTQVWPLNFTNFSNVIFGGFLQFVPNVWLYATALHCTGNDLFLPECSIARGSVCCFYGLSQFERAGPPKTFFFESLKKWVVASKDLWIMMKRPKPIKPQVVLLCFTRALIWPLKNKILKVFLSKFY